VIGKQSNPLVLRSKPKAITKVPTTQKVDVLIPVSKELPNASKKVEIEIEKEPKVGQKRKYDQIKNIASEIEKKQKDEKMIVDTKKDEKLIVDN